MDFLHHYIGLCAPPTPKVKFIVIYTTTQVSSGHFSYGTRLGRVLFIINDITA